MLVSVIIPTANRVQLLALLLEALRRQLFDDRFEIIVVDDCLETDLNHLSFETSWVKCTVVRGEGKGPARARNLGVSCAIGLYLVFLDDDSVVDPTYLTRVAEHLERRHNYALGGPQRSIDRKNSFALASEWLADRFVDGERLDEHRFGFTPTNGFALRRSDFQLTGGFSPHFPLAASEDDEFCARWVAAGRCIDVLPELEIQHHFPPTLAAFVSQQWRYGRGAWHFQLSVPLDKQPRVRPMRFYIGLLFGPFRCYGPLRAIPVAALAAFSQFIVWAGYVRGRMVAEPRNAQAVARAAKESAK
jgi:glycosyltransferase involved in cell wall biosynthesis